MEEFLRIPDPAKGRQETGQRIAGETERRVRLGVFTVRNTFGEGAVAAAANDDDDNAVHDDGEGPDSIPFPSPPLPPARKKERIGTPGGRPLVRLVAAACSRRAAAEATDQLQEHVILVIPMPVLQLSPVSRKYTCQGSAGHTCL